MRPAALLLILAILSCRPKPPAPQVQETKPASIPEVKPAPAPEPAVASKVTEVHLHNVILNEGPGLKLRVRWLEGKIMPTRANVVPSFDERDSFMLDIEAGVIGVSLADLTQALNGSVLKNSSLKDVSLTSYGKQLKMNGTLHKGLSLPVEMISDLGAMPDGRIRIHIAKLRVLKVPLKGLLKVFDVKAGDLVDMKGAKGIQVDGNDIFLDPEQILPEPRKRGKLTDVHLAKGNIVEVYGSPRPEVQRHKEWRNFFQLRGGQLGFGKLTMQHTDIVMIDVSQGDWFDFDLARYQEQIVRGYIRITPEAGLRIFMPGINQIPQNEASSKISLQWMKNRNLPPPEDLLR